MKREFSRNFQTLNSKKVKYSERQLSGMLIQCSQVLIPWFSFYKLFLRQDATIIVCVVNVLRHILCGTVCPPYCETSVTWGPLLGVLLYVAGYCIRPLGVSSGGHFTGCLGDLEEAGGQC